LNDDVQLSHWYSIWQHSRLQDENKVISEATPAHTTDHKACAFVKSTQLISFGYVQRYKIELGGVGKITAMLLVKPRCVDEVSHAS
jgi:hypothetical protein